MNKFDQFFIKQIKRKIPLNISVTEEVASILGISYDAAYRRIGGKVSFTLDEAVQLSKKLDISLNNLYEVGDKNSFLVTKNKPIRSIVDYRAYLKNLNREFEPLKNKEDCSIFFFSRELPMFLFFDNPILTKFKIFLWFSLIKIQNIDKRISFNDFVVADEIYEDAKILSDTYNSINATEMWSFSSLNSALQQVLYFFNMRQIDKENTLAVLNALQEKLKEIESNTLILSPKPKRKFELYSNDLFMTNNIVMLKQKDQLAFAYPYALMNFFRIYNQEACREQETNLIEQLKYSRCITNASLQEHTSFFNNMYDRLNEVMLYVGNGKNKMPRLF